MDQLLTFWTWSTVPTIGTTFTYGHIRWKDVESTTSIIIECFEGHEERLCVMCTNTDLCLGWNSI